MTRAQRSAAFRLERTQRLRPGVWCRESQPKTAGDSRADPTNDLPDPMNQISLRPPTHLLLGDSVVVPSTTGTTSARTCHLYLWTGRSRLLACGVRRALPGIDAKAPCVSRRDPRPAFRVTSREQERSASKGASGWPQDFVGIIGMSRSGSTVLGLALAGRPRTIFVGESRHFDRQWRAGRPCGCGQLLNECVFWASLIKRSGGSPPPASDQRATAWLLRAASKECDARVLVDSGKDVRQVLSLADELRARNTLIHLVRDPRGHLISAHQGWRGRRRSDLAPPWKDVVRVTTSWWRNQLISTLLLRNRSHSLVRYEDLVADPERMVRQISSQWDQGDGRSLGFEHVIAGNPVRMSGKPIEFRLDSRWHGMSRTKQLAAFVMGFPFTVRYRYPLWVSLVNE